MSIMLVSMLSWFGAFAAYAVAISLLSTPARQLPGYLPFEILCLLPWSLGMFLVAARKGTTAGISALMQMCAVMAVTYPTHIFATHGKFWAYFQDKDILAGIRFAGVPMEEFLFYPLAINLAILLYLLLCAHIREKKLPDLKVNRRSLRLFLGSLALVFLALGIYAMGQRDPSAMAATRTWDAYGIPHYAEGPRELGWTIVCLFSVAFNLFLLYLAELFTPMMLRAVLPVMLIFFCACLLIDLLGVSRGWWVFNSQQTSGLWLGGALPVENLPSYLTGVTLSIAVFETCRRLLGEKRP